MIRRPAIVAVLLVGSALSAAARAVAPSRHARSSARERTVWDSVFTLDQATRGQGSYNQTCARCHQPSLGGADDAPALTGSAFLGNWNGQTLADLQERIRTTMPNDDPGSYGRALITDVIAYVLSVNGFPAGAVELPAGSEALRAIRLVTGKP